MKKYLFHTVLLVVLAIAAFTACHSAGKSIVVEGEIASAEGKTLYFEQRGLAGIQLLDSAKLNRKGSFRFKGPVVENPEFFQLRIDNQSVVLAADSAETLQVKADAADLYNTFVVEDSPSNNQIREVDDVKRTIAANMDELEKQHENKTIDDVAYISMLDSVLSDYKTRISALILGNPSGAAAYYAVFQKVNGYLIFDPYNRKDYAMFGAVATSWNQYYPQTPRTQHLYNFTMNALKVRKQQEHQERLLENVPVVTQSQLPDIVLADVEGRKIPLSSLKGKVVLLDFTVYNSEFSPKHNIDLNTMYKRYQAQGFEIYQISVDSDVHFWKNAASNVPWVAVRDPQSVYSSILATYNVREIPTAFIINREGDVVARIDNYAQLASKVASVL